MAKKKIPGNSPNFNTPNNSSNSRKDSGHSNRDKNEFNNKSTQNSANFENNKKNSIIPSIFFGKIPTNLDAVLAPFLNLKGQLIIITVIIFICFINTLPNGYCVDDGMVLTGNKFTTQGFAGIKDLLTKDSFIGGMGRNVLPGGRYRPLSLVTFAVEWQFFGNNPVIFHLGNVIFFILTCLVLLQVLRRYLFRNDSLLAFLSTFIFAIHPIHIEAVTNVKGRDEVLALLFLLLSIWAYFKYLDEGRKSSFLLISALASYFLALLSKENPITFLAILPLTLYFFTNLDIKKCIKFTLPYLGVLIVYFLIRFQAAGLNTKTMVLDLFQDPYLTATFSQKYATIILVLGYYLLFLFFPHPSSFDYTYNQIPYREFSDPLVLLSLIIHIGLFGYAILGLKQKKLFSYLILFYLISISIISNIVFNLGGILGERFLFQGSVAGSIAIAAGIIWIFRKASSISYTAGKLALAAVLIPISSLACAKIIVRNQDWKGNETLFLKDVETAPNSARTNKCAGEIYLRYGMQAGDSLQRLEEDIVNVPKNKSEIDRLTKRKRELLDKAIFYLEKSVKIIPTFKEGLIDLGSAYCFSRKFQEAEKHLRNALRLYPEEEIIKFHLKDVLGSEYGKSAYILYLNSKYDEAEPLFQYAVTLNPTYHFAFYHLGQIKGAQKDFEGAVSNFEKAVSIIENDQDPSNDNSDYYNHLGGACFMAGKYDKAVKAFERCLSLSPNYPNAAAGLEASRQRLALTPY